MFFGYTKPCMKRFSSKNQLTGRVGEDLACRFLEQKGFTVIERNYTRPCGEIDIVVIKDREIHFVEVKTIQAEKDSPMSVYPAENMTPSKMKKCEMTALRYVAEHSVKGNWFYDAVFVTLDASLRKAHVEFLPNVFSG
jgi:putative endonuclease